MPRSQQATGCLRLGTAIRVTCEIRQVTLTKLAEDMKTNWDGGWNSLKPPTRPQLSQYINGHRAMHRKTLEAIESALDVDIAGVNRQAYSAHHYRVCRADMEAIEVTCRSTGNVVFGPGPVTMESLARTSNKEGKANA